MSRSGELVRGQSVLFDERPQRVQLHPRALSAGKVTAPGKKCMLLSDDQRWQLVAKGRLPGSPFTGRQSRLSPRK
jgi:hypothetical protein